MLLSVDLVRFWAGVLFEGVALLIVPFLLLRRKEPSSTIAWLLVLLLLPVVGALLYLLFGRDRLRWPAKKKRQADALVRDQVAAARMGLGITTSHDMNLGPTPLSAAEQQIFHVSALLAGGGVSTGNDVRVLTSGDEAYRAIGDAIDGARHHVNAEYYLIKNDETGEWFLSRLGEAARRGVEVRLLCDGYGCLALRRSWKKKLKRDGVRLGLFLPMRSVLLQPVNLRNHRKILVVDGRAGFSGGLNIGDEYRGDTSPGPGHWRDTHYRVIGPASHALSRIFFQDWFYATGEAVDPTPFFPRIAEAAGDATVAIVPSGPDTRTEAIHRLFFAAIAGARERVRITTPYFVPDEAIVLALQVAAMRGVDVRLILPSRSNHRVTFHAGRSFYEELLEAGVRIHEYLPGMIHAKAMVVDRRIVLVGSANMDMRSFRLNFEVHALIHDPPTAEALEAQFDRDLDKTRSINLWEWHKRKATHKISEGAARLVSPLL
jgi:cardiolipin synthase A/B